MDTRRRFIRVWSCKVRAKKVRGREERVKLSRTHCKAAAPTRHESDRILNKRADILNWELEETAVPLVDPLVRTLP